MAVSGGDYSIVAADSRVTNYRTGASEDGREKVFRYPLGWAACGGGVAAQVKFFKEYLNNYVNDTRHKIYISWLRSVKTTIDKAKENGFPETERLMNTCGCFLSIGTEVNHISFECEPCRRRLDGSRIIFHPPKETRRILRLIEKYSVEPSGMEEAIYIMACFLYELSRLTNWVSDTLECGISLQLNDEILFMRLRDTTKAIKRAYKNKTLAELLIVEDVKPTTKEALQQGADGCVQVPGQGRVDHESAI